VESDGTLVTGAGPDRRKEERSVRGRNEQQLDDKEASCISAGGHRTELQFLLAAAMLHLPSCFADQQLYALVTVFSSPFSLNFTM
jgi:hypothetical protein